MKKFIKNILAASMCGVMLLSGCSKEASVFEEMVIVENKDGFTGNVGEVALEAGDTYAVITVKDYGEIKIKLFPEGAPYAVENFVKLAESGYFNGKNLHRIISDFMLQGGSLNGNGTGGTSADGGEFKCEINSQLRHFYGALCYANAAGNNTCQFYIVNNNESQAQISEVYSEYSQYYRLQAEAYGGYLDQIPDKKSEQYNYLKSLSDSAYDVAEGAEMMNETLTAEIEAKYAEVGGVPFLDGGYTVFGQTVEGFDVIDKISSVEVTENAAGEVSQPVEEIIIESVVIMTA